MFGVVMFDSSASENWPNPTSTGNTPMAKKAPGNKKKTALLLAHLPLPLQYPHPLDKMKKSALLDAGDMEMGLQFSEP